MNQLQRHFIIFFLMFNLFAIHVFSQNVIVEGTVNSLNGKSLKDVNIKAENYKEGTISNALGKFKLILPSKDRRIRLKISYVGYKTIDTTLFYENSNFIHLHFVLKPLASQLPGLEVHDRRLKNQNFIRLNPKTVLVSPAAGGGVESLIKTMPGVTSTSELTSQYSVRGGNFDENLIYVNDIEIYRPFLVNSGQQEGLSFINPDLVGGISFSAGGFGVQYGGKMSSVLDIKYKNPQKTTGDIYFSLLGAGISAQGISKNRRFTYLTGIRYKTNKYLLGTLQTKGNYQPDFSDFQTLLKYKFSEKFDVSLLAYASLNEYKVVPGTRQTDFGTVKQTLRFTVYFDGAEKDKYNMAQAGLTFHYRPKKNTDLKFILSGYKTRESETYDIEGQYWIGQVDKNPVSKDRGRAVETLGVGTFLQHARNYFDAQVITVKHLGLHNFKNQIVRWGIKYQHQWVDDRLHEWKMNDSAGYSLPNPVDDPGDLNPQRHDFRLYYFASAHNIININRLSAFISDKWEGNTKNGSRWAATAGLRFYYWDFTGEKLISPRFSFVFEPVFLPAWNFKLSGGVYDQPPFYREIRGMNGLLNRNIRTPRSIQVLLGSDYRFQLWERPFLLTTGIYYKYMPHVIPYEVDNIRIRYYAFQSAKAYAAGIDFKLYGAFVKGVNSWMSLSLLKTAEDIQGDKYINYYDKLGNLLSLADKAIAADSITVSPGYIPRPTDRRLSFAMFFQDYLPGHKDFKVHLRLIYGTGLPFGPPDSERYKQTLRMPDYKRVDVGFSWNPLLKKSKSPWLKRIKSTWISLEIFNLFQVYNTISYIWIKDVQNRQFAIPNYLTTRRINLKVRIKF